MPVPVPVPASASAKRVIVAAAPTESIARIRACAPHDVRVHDVDFVALLERRRDLAGGFVVIDPTAWHVEQTTAIARCAAASGARLVLYSALTATLCRHIAAAAAITAPEVVLSGTEGTGTGLREALRRDIASVPSLVLAGLADRLTRLVNPLGTRVASYLAWAPIPVDVGSFCANVGLSPKVTLARLRECGLADTSAVLEVTRLACACQHLFDKVGVAVVAHLAHFRSERTMRDAFVRRLDATPTEVRRRRRVPELAEALIVAATATY